MKNNNNQEKKASLSLNNIVSFIEGNYNYYKDKFLSSPKYLQEQYHYRLDKCKDDCVPDNACIVCTCPPIKKAWVQTSCNHGKRFPDLMDKPSWEEYKQQHNIDMNLILNNHGVQ